MRVRTTILLLLLLAGAAFVAGLTAIRHIEQQKYEASAAQRRADWTAKVEAFLNQQDAVLVTMVNQLSSIDGALGAALDGNRNWAMEAWDDKALASYEANALWVIRRNGTLFFSKANTAREELSDFPVKPADIEKLFARSEQPHFFFALPRTPSGGLRMVEVRGVPMRPPGAEGIVPPAEGYFFAGRVWDKERLAEWSLLSDGDEVSLQPPTEDSADAPVRTELEVVRDWADWRGQPTARLVISNRSATLAGLVSRGERVVLAVCVGALLVFGALYWLLDRAVVRPLQRVIESLHTENVALLAPLEKQRAEFGELARLIHLFFAQRADLMREISERSAAEKALRASEEMLRHSQKMEAVGRLAGGVAHDFNNLLTAIIGYADLLRQRFAHEPAARQPAELIHQAGDQAAGLTRQLLAFSRKQLLQPKIIDLNRIVTNLHRLLQRIIGEHIEIHTATEATRSCVKADPGQIEQVIVNLGVNARDAMPRGGRLTIRTARVDIGPDDKIDALPPGGYVALEVADTGEGMDEETRSRIFEPFFTTKGPGKGTGLGLATVYGIVRQSHGGIVVESERGRGSTFRILLPSVDAPADTVESAPALAPKADGAGTILVVEDEEIVRELVCEVLRGHGYCVLDTASGPDAVRLVRKENGRIDLLISDVVMPEMNGAEVARSVQETAPLARVLFVSGYSENDMADQGLEVLAFEVLQKPFTPAALLRKVEEILKTSTPAAQTRPEPG